MEFPIFPRVRYLKNPLEEVICQLRFPKILRIEATLPVDFQDAIRSEYPIYNTSQSVEFVTNPQINISPAMIGRGRAYEFVDEKKEWKLVLSSDFIALSSSKYERWEDFRNRLSKAVDLLIKHYEPSHFSRLGLRYQDLIMRSDFGLNGCQWNSLIQPYLLGYLSEDLVSEEDVFEFISVFSCHLNDEDENLRVRYGFAKKDDSDELGYLIDADFYNQKIIEVNNAITALDRFNREAGNFFRWCITEQLHGALEPQPIE